MTVQIGQREFGRYQAGEDWYLCGICGRPTRISETRVPQPPEAHAGSRICLRPTCNDQPGAEYFSIVSPPRVGDDELID